MVTYIKYNDDFNGLGYIYIYIYRKSKSIVKKKYAVVQIQ